jgi:hypothetical protein
MSRSKFAVMIVSAVFVGVLSTGCGGSSDSGSTVVAQVGSATITKATLDHWMATFVRGDYYQATGGLKAPPGLATDPADYGSCVAAAKTLAPSPSSGKLILSKAQLEHRCRALYRDVRQEALSYLISVLWAEGQSAELGKHVSEQQVQHYLGGVIEKQYKTRQVFATYLANKGWSLPDMYYILKRNLLEQKLLSDAKVKASQHGGGQQAWTKVVIERDAKWTAKTNCRAGYTVSQCRDYKLTATATTESSPAVMFEEMRGARLIVPKSH